MCDHRFVHREKVMNKINEISNQLDKLIEQDRTKEIIENFIKEMSDKEKENHTKLNKKIEPMHNQTLIVDPKTIRKPKHAAYEEDESLIEIVAPKIEIVAPSAMMLSALSIKESQIFELFKIEFAGRTAYKSDSEFTTDTANAFIRNLIKRGHESVLEHAVCSMKIVCDRGVSHELVRHRIASYTQESQRYCNYEKGKFGGKIMVIRPSRLKDMNFEIWKAAMEYAANIYMNLIKSGEPPQIARSVLPNAVKTEIVVTMNFREWRHFLKLRTAPDAHPDMQVVANLCLEKLYKQWPAVFEDIWKMHILQSGMDC